MHAIFDKKKNSFLFLTDLFSKKRTFATSMKLYSVIAGK